MYLMNDVIFEEKIEVLDTTDLNNIHDVLIVKERVVNTLVDLIRYLTLNTSIDPVECANYVAMSYEYNNGEFIDNIYIDNNVLEEIKEYIDEYLEWFINVK